MRGTSTVPEATTPEGVLLRGLGLTVAPDLLAEFDSGSDRSVLDEVDLLRRFVACYGARDRPLHRLHLELAPGPFGVRVDGTMRVDYTLVPFRGDGDTADRAIDDAFGSVGFPVVVLDEARGEGGTSPRCRGRRAHLVRARVRHRAPCWGLGLGITVAESRTEALVSAINRAYPEAPGWAHRVLEC